jgi:hypothetical protein
LRDALRRPDSLPQAAEIKDNPQGSSVDDLSVQDLTISGGKPSNTQLSIPVRPAYGTHDTEIVLWTNHFEMKVEDRDLILYLYHIHVSPINCQKPAGKKRERLVKLFLNGRQMSVVGRSIFTDFRSRIVSFREIAVEFMERVEITYLADNADDSPSTLQRPPEKYFLWIDQVEESPASSATLDERIFSRTRSLPLSRLLDYLDSINHEEYNVNKSVFSQVLNILLNHYAKAKPEYTAIGKRKSFPTNHGERETSEFHDGLYAIRGFFSSVRPMTGRILVNINVSHGAFYSPGTLQNTMRKHGLSKLKSLHMFLRLLRVKTNHLPPKKNKNSLGEPVYRIKTIWGLATPTDGYIKSKGKWIKTKYAPKVQSFGAGPQDVQFYREDKINPASGRFVTVWDHFHEQYNDILERNQISLDPRLPVVNVGNLKEPRYLPAEVCDVMPHQYFNKKLNPSQTQLMIQFAVRSPHLNLQSITRHGLLAAGVTSDNAILNALRIKVNQDPITVRGRVLKPPTVMYKGNVGIPDEIMERSSWSITNNMKLCKGAKLSRWGGVFIKTTQSPNIDLTILQMLRTAMLSVGIDAGIPTRPHVVNWRDQNTVEQLRNCFTKARQDKIELFFVIMPDSSEIYADIKQLGDIEFGVHTVCAVDQKIKKVLSNATNQGDKKFGKRNDPYLTNIALKINMKLGGHNHTVHPTNLGVIGDGKTMVVGIDVTHPSPQSGKDAPSVASMVASVDKTLSQWPATLRVQKSRQEKVDDLKSMLKRHIDIWKNQNKGVSPENILIYRDGVSEGQYSMVINHEFPQLLDACKEKYKPAELPKFTVIVAAKRHNTRFYPTDATHASKGNTKPGTVVDRGVTDMHSWDFYMQPHAAIQGTARPGHYIVLFDQIFRSCYQQTSSLPLGCNSIQDALELITLGMSYTFGRATKGISLCSPARYVDLACDRARIYLKNLFESDGTSTVDSLSEEEAVRLAQLQEKVKIHKNLENSMFYI